MSMKTFCPTTDLSKPDLTCCACKALKPCSQFQRENKIKDGVEGHVWRSKCTACVKESLPTKKEPSLREKFNDLEASLADALKTLAELTEWKHETMEQQASSSHNDKSRVQCTR